MFSRSPHKPPAEQRTPGSSARDAPQYESRRVSGPMTVTRGLELPAITAAGGAPRRGCPAVLLPVDIRQTGPSVMV